MINKKFIFKLLIIFIIIVILSALAWRNYSLQKQKATEVVLPPVTPTPEVLSTWEDQSEFVFHYPQNLKLDPHSEDQENYAHVELKSIDHPGNIIVWTKDTTSQTLENYIKTNKITNYVDSSLGGIEAIKVLKTPADGGFVISSIRNGYLYQIEVSPEKDDFWLKVFDTVAASYQFQEGEKDSTSPNQTKEPSAEEFFETEEIIE